MKKYITPFAALLTLGLVLTSCRDDKMMDLGDLEHIAYNPEAYIVSLPGHFPQLESPEDNPLTKDGVILGQHLFYDPILSADSTMSCASCHFPEKAFTDGKAVSVGIDGIAGTKSSMSVVNLAFTHSGLFWDGRADELEDQALLPVEDPIELHNDWKDLITKLQKHPTYPTLFRKAFGIKDHTEMTKELAGKAIAQFERIIISGNSKFDRVLAGQEIFTDLEELGNSIFFDNNPDVKDGECNHCHSFPLMTADDYFNNGLQKDDGSLNFPSNGRGDHTGILSDNGKFKAPTLRNIALTAPYMHDGRFETLDEVLEFYNSGGNNAKNVDPLIHELGLTPRELRGLKAFLLTLTDTSYMQNPYVTNPFK